MYSLKCLFENIKGKKNDFVSQTWWILKEKQGVTESEAKLLELTIVPRRTLFISGTPTAPKVTLYPDVVTHYGMEEVGFTRIDDKNCTACAGVHRRGKKKKKNRGEKQDRGKGCWYMQTQWHRFGKASSSGWLVNRGVKLPCGSQSVGKSQAHWFNLYISVINVYRVEPGDYWNLCFF